jgi:hypothetical protein
MQDCYFLMYLGNARAANMLLKSLNHKNFIMNGSRCKSFDFVKIIIETCRECEGGAGNGN